jgi:transposase-like protein
MEYKPRRKLTREFKLEAVRQAALSEKPKAQLAWSLVYASASCERGGSSSRRRR